MKYLEKYIFNLSTIEGSVFVEMDSLCEVKNCDTFGNKLIYD